jgi:DNA-nicking Smr family endonuclease
VKRTLAPEEAALWKRVIATVTPLAKPKAAPVQTPAPTEAPVVSPSAKAVRPAPVVRKPEAKPPRTLARPLPARREESNTLDGSWDRKLSRGLISPESSIDLHGHSLSGAYDRLDHGLDHAIRRGDRVLLLVTGKPPRPESERPHARGAIRAAVGDWLASSRHADRIAAVRGAHPRHGGTGALYIILRRPKTPPSRNS